MPGLHSTASNGAGLDLSRMCRQPLFTSDSAQESRRLLGEQLVEHELTWQHGGVDTAFYHSTVGDCELYALRYGGEVEVRPQPFEDFVLVQMPLRGTVTLSADGQHRSINAGEVAWLAPCEETRLLWREGCEQLILKIPQALFSGCQLSAQHGKRATLPAISQLSRPLAIRWLRLVSELLEHLPGAGTGAASSPWLAHVQNSLPLFLLSHLATPHSQVSAPDAPRSTVSRQVQRLEAVLQAHLTQPISLAQLASSVGASVRSLNSLCQREHGQSPMERLRSLRLEAARRCLMADEQASVTHIALQFGFGHAGRFARYYQQRFGELPGHTCGVNQGMPR